MHYRNRHTLSYFSDSFASGFSPLYSVVYSSVATRPIDEQELDALVADARENNAEVGITGMLLYYEGVFLQALEGTEEFVRALYERIALDQRHQQMTILLEEYIPARNFEEWSMGYCHMKVEDAVRLAGFVLAPDAGQFLTHFQQSPQKSIELLQSLYR